MLWFKSAASTVRAHLGSGGPAAVVKSLGLKACPAVLSILECGQDAPGLMADCAEAAVLLGDPACLRAVFGQIQHLPPAVVDRLFSARVIRGAPRSSLIEYVGLIRSPVEGARQRALRAIPEAMDARLEEALTAIVTDVSLTDAMRAAAVECFAEAKWCRATARLSVVLAECPPERLELVAALGQFGVAMGCPDEAMASACILKLRQYGSSDLLLMLNDASAAAIRSLILALEQTPSVAALEALVGFAFLENDETLYAEQTGPRLREVGFDDALARDTIAMNLQDHRWRKQRLLEEKLRVARGMFLKLQTAGALGAGQASLQSALGA